MLKNRVYLLGFMGSGKSFASRKLAQELGWDLLDLDDLIVAEEGLSINEIFQKYGETHFRILENKYLKETKNLDNVVIALGGGTPCFLDNMDWILKNGISFFLDIPIEIILRRLLRNPCKRPLLKDKNEEELRNFVEQKMMERRPIYEQSNYVINNPNNIITEIITKLKQ